MTIKKFLFKLHLWIGLPGAIIFFFICFTGSLFVFSDEIMTAVNKPYSSIEKVGTEWISIEEMEENVQATFPENRITYITASKSKNSCIDFLIMGPEGLQDIFVNPYNGKIVGQSKIAQFFYIVAHLHSMLLWRGPGGWIIKIATLFFIITLISGLSIWWPKRKSKRAIKHAFTYQTKTAYKRKIFDWHRVWGFYALGILLFLSITGSILAFKPLYNAVSRTAGGKPDVNLMKAYPIEKTKKPIEIGSIIKHYLRQPNTKKVRVSLFLADKSAVYRLLTGTEIGIITNNGATHFIDQYSGKEIKNAGVTKDFEVQNKLMRLHTGKYWGWFGLFITFIGGLLGSFLSITGVLVWVQKSKNKSFHMTKKRR